MGGPKWGPTVSLLFLKSAAPGSPGPTPDTQQPSRSVNPSPVMGNFSPSHMELTPLQTSLPPCSSILSLNLDPNPSIPAPQHFSSDLYGV